jgi:hypothetical protein
MIAMAKRKPIPPPPPPPTYRRDYSAGLDLPPDAAEFLNQIMADDPRELVDLVEAELAAVANEQFEAMRLEILAKEEERKSLWGNKFPRVLGQKPGEKAGKHGPGRPRTVPAGTDPPKG